MKTNHKDRVMTKAHQAYLDNHPNKEEIEQFKKSQSYQPVPTEITKDSRLSKTAKLLYGVILASDRSGLGCLMKNKTLQAWMDNISQPALWYQLNSLRSVGAIEIAKDPKTKQRVIIPLVRILKNSDEPVAESNKPGLLKPISPAYYPPQNNEAERPEITGKSRRQLSPKIRYKDKGIPDIPLRGNLKSPLRGFPKPKPLVPSKLTCSKWAEDL
ncbi:MAG: hypothetical protein KKF27_21560, partial [Gammaproteobacteria bacterium]|nr:hypothetical protein [Gammaproteobacteria bacterium]